MPNSVVRAFEAPIVAVVGAGASGMAAAIAAAVSGARVRLFESRPKPGRSVMASGNGRCNFANSDLAPERYNNPAFVAQVMGDDPLAPILDFFENLGLWWCADDEGRLFPRSRAAASVLDILTAALDRLGVDVVLNERVTGLVRPSGSSAPWTVTCESGDSYKADAVVWAAGGATGVLPAHALGLDLVDERPALCPLACTPKPPKLLDGVRATCAVSLRSGRTLVERMEGEVLFRPYGLSGIVVFDLSRLAQKGDVLELDVMPDVELDRLTEVLERRLDAQDGRFRLPLERLAFLDGALHPKLGRILMEQHCGRDGSRSIDPAGLARLIKAMRFTVVGPADAGAAQVTQGGLDVGAFDPMTLQARAFPGFFSCGEALDVDGACGGFNLAWAWSSGMVAGVAAARTVRAL